LEEGRPGAEAPRSKSSKTRGAARAERRGLPAMPSERGAAPAPLSLSSRGASVASVAKDDTSHAAPASAKATAAAVGGFFFLVIAAAIVYALVAG
jgi:hypothetical protein